MTKPKLPRFLALSTMLILGPWLASAAIPPRNVSLTCSDGHVLHCSISRMANPEYNSNCWYIAGNQSWLMKKDYRFTFYNNLVRVHLNNGMKITANLINLSSGAHAFCRE